MSWNPKHRPSLVTVSCMCRYYDTTWGNRDSGVDEALVAAAREARRVDCVAQMKWLTCYWMVAITGGNLTLYALQRVVSRELGREFVLSLIVVVVFAPFFLQIIFMPAHFMYMYCRSKKAAADSSSASV